MTTDFHTASWLYYFMQECPEARQVFFIQDAFAAANAAHERGERFSPDAIADLALKHSADRHNVARLLETIKEHQP